MAWQGATLRDTMAPLDDMAQDAPAGTTCSSGGGRGLGPVHVLLLAGLVLSAAALGLGYASRTLFGPAAAWVNVRWAPHVDEPRRQALERQFHLVEGEPREGTTYLYLLVDTSFGNIRELVAHPEVLDTHHLDRSAFTLSNTAERVILSDPVAQRRSRHAATAAILLWRAAAGAVVLALLIGVVPVRVRLEGAVRSAARLVTLGLSRSIPEISAEAAALFRVAFGSALMMSFVLTPVSVPPGPQPEDTPWLTRIAGDVFIASPHLADIIEPWLLVSGALFVAGAFTRMSFAAFTGAALAWGVVASLRAGHHPFSALLIAMLCLLPSRWGDAWSIDAWRRRGRQPAAHPREYGYTIWIPGVVLGLALAAAAASKLMEGGIAWALNGSVKYHILTDADIAPVDWGVRFALGPGVAVALSFGALAVESLVLPAALIGSWPVRMAAALATASVFVGFWAFHAVFWPWWWTLLLAFAPWHRVYPRRRRPLESEPVDGGRRILRLRHVQVAVLALAIAQQLAASAWRVEVPPMISAYDMYSKTYSSPEEYVQTAADSHWLVADMRDQTVSSCRVSEAEARMIAAAPVSEDKHGTTGHVLARCFSDIRAVRTVSVEQARRNVDWAVGRYLGAVRVRVAGPAPLTGGESRPGR